MAKKIFAIFTISVVILGFSSNLVLAKNDSVGDIPEEDGIYDVPGRHDLKVRVLVHRTNPSPQPTSEFVCGLDDLNSSAVVDSAGWKLPAKFTYNLNLGSVPLSVGGASLATITGNAFQVWTKAISNKVAVDRGSDTSLNRKGLDGKNIIAWGRISASALGVTYIWYNTGTGVAVEIDTILNQKYFWMWSGGSVECAYTNAYDAQSILTHEIGHWYGLDDEYASNYANNTMYGYGSMWEVKDNTLTDGDIAGARSIY
jgi:hypothetical protein